MKVKLDENVPNDAVAIFAEHGHDVHTIVDENLVGHSDDDVGAACVAEQRMLVTFDLGFGDVRAYSTGLAHRCRRATDRPGAKGRRGRGPAISRGLRPPTCSSGTSSS